MLCIQGDNLDSVETSEIRVTVGGEECVKIPSNSRGSDIICTVPLERPGGQDLAIINVSNYIYKNNCLSLSPSGDHWEQHLSSIGPATDLSASYLSWANSSSGDHHSSYCCYLCIGRVFTDDCDCWAFMLMQNIIIERMHSLYPACYITGLYNSIA